MEEELQKSGLGVYCYWFQLTSLETRSFIRVKSEETKFGELDLV